MHDTKTELMKVPCHWRKEGLVTCQKERCGAASAETDQIIYMYQYAITHWEIRTRVTNIFRLRYSKYVTNLRDAVHWHLKCHTANHTTINIAIFRMIQQLAQVTQGVIRKLSFGHKKQGGREGRQKKNNLYQEKIKSVVVHTRLKIIRNRAK